MGCYPGFNFIVTETADTGGMSLKSSNYYRRKEEDACVFEVREDGGEEQRLNQLSR